MKSPLSKVVIGLVVLILAAGVYLVISDQQGKKTSAIDKKSFQKLAQNNLCREIANQMYIINDQYVFWIQKGNCADASYSYQLYASKPKDLICSYNDSIAGPVTECSKPELKTLFETMINNEAKDNLGLDSSYAVEVLPITER